MSIELVEVTKNTRGVNSREIKYKAIGRYVTKIVQKESKPEFNDDGSPKLDDKGNQIRTPLGKDGEGKLITIPEEVQEFESDGVVTSIEDAMELVNNDEQILFDCFADGFNERAYAIEANKDELDEFLADMELNEEQKASLKRAVRQLNRGTDTPILEAAEFVKTMWLKNKAKAKPVAVPATA